MGRSREGRFSGRQRLGEVGEEKLPQPIATIISIGASVIAATLNPVRGLGSARLLQVSDSGVIPPFSDVSRIEFKPV
jgi:hypothetical protein